MASVVPFTPAGLPERFVTNLTGAFSDKGPAFIERLPQIVQECAEKWDLTVDAFFPNLSYNFVAPGRTASGEHIVLKVGVPHTEFRSEGIALRAWNGDGVCHLLQVDLDLGAMVIQRIRPGTMLSELPDDDDATRIAATIMRQLRIPAPAGLGLPTVTTWSQGFQRLRTAFDGGTGPLPELLVRFAEQTYSELGQPSTSDVLLHADLHHFNILRSEDGWLAIDPKGITGPREYEVCALLRNHTREQANDPEVQARRIRILAEELDYDPAIIARWNVAQAVLSQAWSLEDGESFKPVNLKNMSAAWAVLPRFWNGAAAWQSTLE